MGDLRGSRVALSRGRGRFLAVSAAMTMSMFGLSGPADAVPRCWGERATIVGTDESNSLVGTPGRDVIVGLGGWDYINGRGGNDLICGNEGDDALRGGRGADKISGGTEEDLIDGNRGADRLSGGVDPDDISGGAGEDIIRGGGGGMDSAYFTGSSHVTANLTTGWASGQGRDKLIGIENLSGLQSGGATTFIGNDRRNIFLGGEGRTILEGRGGNDRLNLDSWERHRDVVKGGRGNDSLSFQCNGGLGNDTFTGGSGVDILSYCGPGISADLAAGTVTGAGQGNDSVGGIENLVGTADDDTLLGSSADNYLDGFDGTDTIDGRGGQDTCRNGENVSNCEA